MKHRKHTYEEAVYILSHARKQKTHSRGKTAREEHKRMIRCWRRYNEYSFRSYLVKKSYAQDIMTALPFVRSRDRFRALALICQFSNHECAYSGAENRAVEAIGWNPYRITRSHRRRALFRVAYNVYWSLVEKYNWL